MPVYMWRSIDLAGNIIKGVMAARSEQELEKLLFKADKALLSCKKKRITSRLRPISLITKIDFFKQLATLISSGIFLDQALRLLAASQKHAAFRELIQDMQADVLDGYLLSDALMRHPELFDTITICLIKAGQESGQLSEALRQLCVYQEARNAFTRKVRTALFIPCITFLFFLVITLLIFIVIVPSFADMFLFSRQEIPQATQFIFALSVFLRSAQLPIACSALLALVLAIRYMVRKAGNKLRLDAFLLHVPLLGSFIKELHLSYFFQIIAMLRKGGVPMLDSLLIARDSIENDKIKSVIDTLRFSVENGSALSDAMIQARFFESQVIALVEVGQESGQLPFLLFQAAQVYRDKVHKFLNLITIIIQPALMLLLGVMIMLLIFAIYLPIFNLSNVMY